MEQKIPTFQTWRFFQETHRILGKTYLTRLYSRSRREISEWCADAALQKHIRRNPLDLMRINFIDLAEAGAADVALNAMNLLLEPFGCEASLNLNEDIQPAGIHTGRHGPINSEVFLGKKIPTLLETWFFFLQHGNFWERIIWRIYTQGAGSVFTDGGRIRTIAVKQDETPLIA